MTDAIANTRAQIVGAIFDHVRAVTEDGKPAGLVVDSVHDAVDAIMAVQGAHTAIRDRLGIGAPDPRIATLETALEPFAAIADAPAWRHQAGECKVVTMHFGPAKWLSITLGDLRRAKAALGGKAGSDG